MLTPHGLQKVDGTWRQSGDWASLQPQRVRVIKPILYAYCQECTTISIKVNTYAESFPEPIELKAEAELKIEKQVVTLMELVPSWEAIVGGQEAGEVQPRSLL
jgi:hypothetical protein